MNKLMSKWRLKMNKLMSKWRLTMNELTLKGALVGLLGTALAVAPVTHAQGSKALSQRSGVTSKDLIVREVDGINNLEFIVIDVSYEPGGINPLHRHPAAVTFYVISGTPVFQEKGKEPVTLKPGDSLLVPAGTIHSHWNPSKTEGVRWLEFIATEKGKGKAIRLPLE